MTIFIILISPSSTLGEGNPPCPYPIEPKEEYAPWVVYGFETLRSIYGSSFDFLTPAKALSAKDYCSTNIPKKHIKHMLYGDEFEEYLQVATKEAHAFKSGIMGRGPNSRLTKLTEKLKDRFVGDKRIIGGLPLDFQDDIKTIEKRTWANPGEAQGDHFKAFKGSWSGKWRELPVDHFWCDLIVPEKPIPVKLNKHQTVCIRSYQYAWVGTGYGINLSVSDDCNEGESKTGEYILGHVVHVKNGDLSQEDKRVPHIGAYTPSNDGLIWVTPGHAFFERTFDGGLSYAITGTKYSVDQKGDVTLGEKNFQTIYSRPPKPRGDFLEFD